MENVELRKQWDVRISDYRASGLTAAGWCAREGVTVPQLKYWLAKARKAATQVGPAKWSRVEVISESQLASMITINVGVARIEVKSRFDAVLLGEVLRVAVASC